VTVSNVDGVDGIRDALKLSTKMVDKTHPDRIVTPTAQTWEKFRDAIFARLQILEDAAVALMEGNLDADFRGRATAEARELASSIGVFDFPEGTRLARSIELLLRESAARPQPAVLMLSDLVVALRAELDRGPGRSPPRADMVESSNRLLVFSDDTALAGGILVEGGGRGFAPLVVSEPTAAVGAIERMAPAAIVVDMSGAFGGEPGRALFDLVARKDSEWVTVVLAPSDTLAERIEAAQRGVHAYIRKPARAREIIDVVSQSSPRCGAAGSRLMIVHRDGQTLLQVRSILEARGLSVVEVIDPERFLSSIEQYRPDLLVIAQDLPDVTGSDLCRVVRSHHRWNRIPVVLLTSRVDPETVQEIFEAGADDFVSMPLAQPDLITRIESRLHRARLHRALQEERGLGAAVSKRQALRDMERLIRLGERAGVSVAVALVSIQGDTEPTIPRWPRIFDEAFQTISFLLASVTAPGDVLGRYGQRGFLVGLFGTDKVAAAKRLNEAIVATDRKAISVEGETLTVSYEGGVAAFPGDGDTIDKLLQTARHAMAAVDHSSQTWVVPSGGSTAEEAPEFIDIILIEDDTVLAALLLHAMQTQGYSAKWIDNGEDALAALGGPCPSLRARLILLEVDIPGLDGLTLLRALVRDRPADRVPVIVITQRTSEAEVLKALEAGATDHVAKPFSLPVLMQRIQTVI
jgi:DNA-binding response OmpR family regulator